MIDVFASFLPKIKQREGGGAFTNRPADRGGPTRWGVTAATLGAWLQLGRPATASEVAALSEATADRILRLEYFLEPGFDKVAEISPAIAEELVDTGVNMGTYWPRKWLQENLNLCNERGRVFADLKVDGDLGQKTRDALVALIRRRGQRDAEALLLRLLNADQVARYKIITTTGGPNGEQEENFCGWILGRVSFGAAV